MSSLGIDQSLLSSPPANSSLTVPTAIGRGSRIPLLLAASDWMTATPAMYGVLLEHSSRGRHVLSSLLVSACIAALVVVLQVNDGAYRGDSGPLRIREVEHTIRAGAQASLLILLVSLMLGDVSLRGAVELSVCAAVSALIIEKLLLSRAICEERQATAGRGYELIKRAADLVLATLLIAALLPFGLLVALLVSLDSPGPAVFRQQRAGRGGRLFTIYKFRSMYAGAPQYAVSPDDRTDPRITRMGRLLRRTNIDELPQLLNVVKGEMSLVGPRPEMPFLVEQHEAVHRLRLEVTPGMTGLWQLSPARAARIHENPHYDQYYIQRRSFCMDLAILFYTPLSFFRGI